jgi:hypothetical protein
MNPRREFASILFIALWSLLKFAFILTGAPWKKKP